MWQWLESQVCERNNETASSLRFNKPESANFIFDCMQYFIPKEGRSRLLRTGASVVFLPPGALGGSQQMRECRGLHANPPWLDIDFFPFLFSCNTKVLQLFSRFIQRLLSVWWRSGATVSSWSSDSAEDPPLLKLLFSKSSMFKL